MFDLDTRQRGHGHIPLSRIVAMSALIKLVAERVKETLLGLHSLFGVIGRVCENSRIDSPVNAIKATNYYTIFVCIDKVVVK
jgi:hypothetical protein